MTNGISHAKSLPASQTNHCQPPRHITASLPDTSLPASHTNYCRHQASSAPPTSAILYHTLPAPGSQRYVECVLDVQNLHRLGQNSTQRCCIIRTRTTRLISLMTGAKMQRLEVVRRHSEFLSHLSIPQAIPTQPVTVPVHVQL